MTIREGDRVRVRDEDTLRQGMVGSVRRILRADRDYRRRAVVAFEPIEHGAFEPYTRIIALDLLEPIR